MACSVFLGALGTSAPVLGAVLLQGFMSILLAWFVPKGGEKKSDDYLLASVISTAVPNHTNIATPPQKC